MNSPSVTQRILQTVLSLAVLLQCVAGPASVCSAGGVCCSDTRPGHDSTACCCGANTSTTSNTSHVCCESVETHTAADAASCCDSTDHPSDQCHCQANQSQPTPATPPVNSDTQPRLTVVYNCPAETVIPANATTPSSGRSRQQSSLLKTAPRSVQVLFCTWWT